MYEDGTDEVFENTDKPDDNNQPLYEGYKHTTFSAYSLIMLLATKRGLCREGFTELLEILADLLPKEASFTTSVYKLKEALKTCMNYQEQTTHYFCETCQCLLDDSNVCTKDACQRAESRTLEFCDLDFPRQLKEMFKDDKFLQLVLKENNLHQNQNTFIKGISSGTRYKEVVADNQNSSDVVRTFTLNTTSECREWLVHFSVPVLYGILNPDAYLHYLLLVTGIATLTSDCPHHDQVTEAEENLREFCCLFPAIYGIEKQTMNLYLVKHLGDTVRFYGPLYEYSYFGFESMNSFIKKWFMVLVTSINSLAVGMSKQLTAIIKRFTSGGVDSKTQQLFKKLSSKLVENENEFENVCLGRGSTMKETSPYYQHLSEDIKTQQLKTYGRLCSNKKFCHSKEYQHAKTRCDYVVCLASENEFEMGIILTFIEVNDQIFAVVKKCAIVPFSINQHMLNEVTYPALKDLARKQLCSHIYKFVDYGNIVLVHSSRLRKKGIWMKMSPTLTFLSVPPNNLEHN